MIYCVVPEALADELFEKLTDYYATDDNVEVIVDRRKSSRRKPSREPNPAAEQRTVRDRRRARVTGDIPDTTLVD